MSTVTDNSQGRCRYGVSDGHVISDSHAVGLGTKPHRRQKGEHSDYDDDVFHFAYVLCVMLIVPGYLLVGVHRNDTGEDYHLADNHELLLGDVGAGQVNRDS